MNKILLTICARGGSKGVKNKNIKNLNGSPLIYYTIQQAREWGRAKHIVVSTDSEKIAKIAKTCGAEVPFLRPKELAEDKSPKLPVIRHALLECEKIYREKYDFVVDLQPTSPVRKIKDLKNCLKLFLKAKPHMLISVSNSDKNPYFNLVEQVNRMEIRLCKNADRQITRRQDAPKIYAINGSIYIYDRSYLLKKENLSPISDKTVIYQMDEYSSIDIDNEIDFRFVEFLIKEKYISI